MSQTLRMKFGLNSGGDRWISLQKPKANLTAQIVTAAMTELVSNGDAFADALTSAKRAEVVETTTTVLMDSEG